jgi:YidC/Oxa1 family membrane protein insertase
MVQIGNFFGNILGYLLWFFYVLTSNYGIAIILFTVVLKILMFPFSVKQQKSMAASGKMAIKQKELQKKYGNDKQKYNEELQKLYEKEGVNPAGGCLPMLIPFPIMIGLYYTVINPLSNALHVSSDAITQAGNMIKTIPGIASTFNAQYMEMDIVKNFGDLKGFLTMFSTGDLSKIEKFSHGFKFLGLDLLGVAQGSSFSTMLWLIPLLCLVSSLVTQYFTMKLQPGMQQQQGCMKYMMYLLPLFSVWLAYTLPAAVGFYWIISTLTQFVQTIILNIWYSPADLTARAEAQRIALRVQEEEAIKPLPLEVQNQLAAQNKTRINNIEKSNSQKKNDSNKQKSKSNKNKNGDSGSYMGTKK